MSHCTAIIPRPISSSALSFDRAAGRVIDWIRFSANPSNPRDAAVVSLFIQFREQLSHMASFEQRQIELQLHSGRKIRINLSKVFSQLIRWNRQIEQAQENRLLESTYVDVTRQGIPFVPPRPSFSLFAEASSWVIDPSHPASKMKYMGALDHIQSAFDRKYPRWKESLPQFREWAKRSDFAKRALYVLASLYTVDEDVRSRYVRFGEHLREAIRLLPPSAPNEFSILKEMILQISHFKFTQVFPHRFFEDFIFRCLGARTLYERPVLTLQNLADEIAHANYRLGVIPPDYRHTQLAQWFRNLQGTTGIGFDPHLRSNTPWVHSIETGIRECKILRHATPTIGSSWVGSASVIPEYEAYLMAEPLRVTLYCNHQVTGRMNILSPESARSAAIQNLEKRHRNFHFVSLPMDGLLWEERSLNMDQFKEEIASSLVKEENGFALPANEYMRALLRERVYWILNGVHRLYFANQELSSDVKKGYLLLSFSEIKDLLKATLEADYLVSACKDNKDRGNASTTVDFMKTLVKLRKENDPERLSEVFISVLAPFVIKNQEISERLEAALTVIRVLGALSEEAKEKIRKSDLTGYWVEELTVPKRAIAWAKMIGKEEFIASVEAMRRLKEVREKQSPEFVNRAVSSFLRGGKWNLKDLKRQIEEDAPRCEIRFNGRRIISFAALCRWLNIEEALFEAGSLQDEEISPHEQKVLRFMSLLHQGIMSEVVADGEFYFQGNPLKLGIMNGEEEPARHRILGIIKGWNQTQTIDLEEIKEARRLYPERFSLYFNSAIALGFLPKELKPDLQGGTPIEQVYLTRIWGAAEEGEFSITAEQELVLKEPAENEPVIYPFIGKIVWRSGTPARISWMIV
jgi:hypothetical protein